ncbi:hypothetical protein HMPREF1060_00896 [Parabacteroides merdae CL03T12C32]|uniref:Uncharacterized protein n=1 Tax=Parabacteroides merdae CL03T12C32 TaxID=999420 RepID=K6AKN0_9BACT|nr:hypothetical protein HMPREF1060_00896 [Parabacteroides merdae CL03T12C32]
MFLNYINFKNRRINCRIFFSINNIIFQYFFEWLRMKIPL